MLSGFAATPYCQKRWPPAPGVVWILLTLCSPLQLIGDPLIIKAERRLAVYEENTARADSRCASCVR